MKHCKSKIKEVADFWGKQMPMMTCEEAGELIQAISKLERYYTHGEDDPEIEAKHKQNLIDEMGDMMIAINALAEHYDISSKQIGERVEKKLNKKY